MIDVEETESILQQANAWAGLGLKAKDALHLACAVTAGCVYFVTTDDEILRHRDELKGIEVIDPTALVREMNL